MIVCMYVCMNVCMHACMYACMCVCALSGKTYTMKGSGLDLGLLTFAIHHIFQLIDECPDREFLLRVSYMEV